MYDRDKRLPHMYFGNQMWQHMYVRDNHGGACILGTDMDTNLCWKINGGRKCALSIDGRHTCMFEIKGVYICM